MAPFIDLGHIQVDFNQREAMQAAYALFLSQFKILNIRHLSDLKISFV